jgi:glycosyltransferase involved in cell wall biosynthesis
LKLLFLTPQLPFPPDQGAKVRNAALIRIAAEAGHEVDLLTFVGAEEKFPLPMGEGQGGGEGASDQVGTLAHGAGESQPYCQQVVTVPTPPGRPLPARALDTAFAQLPDLARRLWSPVFLETLQRLLHDGSYDLIQAEGLEMSSYLRAVKCAFTVLDEHNAEYLLQQRAWQIDRQKPRRAHAALYSFIQWRRLRRWEARCCSEADTVLAVSDEEAAVLRALSGRDVASVPNGIDLAAIPFRQPSAQVTPNLLFDGTMSFRPNRDAAIWFASEILPIVRAQRPEVRFWVVGREPPGDLVAFNFRPNGVAVTGAVPSVERYWEQAGLYVLPMRMGAGVRFKALEAMARGVPIVSTKLGMAGTSARANSDYLCAERPADFAAAILRLLGDASLRQSLAMNARQAVAAHDWGRVAPRLLEVFERLEELKPRAPALRHDPAPDLP